MNAPFDTPSPRFDRWRQQARGFLLSDTRPEQVDWDSDPLPPPVRTLRSKPGPKPGPFKVTRRFLDFARRVSCHTAPDAGPLLYSALWRLAHDEPKLFEMLHVPLVRKLNDYHKAVSREIQRAHTFLRFRRIETPEGERYVAWFEPQFPIVELTVAPFVERFHNMEWSVLSPLGCAHWEQGVLRFSPGVRRTESMPSEDLEALWRASRSAPGQPAPSRSAWARKRRLRLEASAA